MIQAIAPISTQRRGVHSPGPHERWGYRAGLAAMGLCGVFGVELAELSLGMPTPLALVPLAIVAALLSLLKRRGPRRGVLPHWLIAVASLASFGWAVYEIQALNTPTVMGLAHFFILIVVIKLLDRDSARDNAELLITTLFLMVIGAIVSGHVGYGLLLAAYLWIGLRTLFCFCLKSEAERIETLSATHRAGRTVFAASNLDCPRRLRAGSFLAFGAALLVGGVIFVLTPRVGAGMLGRFHPPAAMAVTGFSDRVEFGDVSDIKTSSRPAMRVELFSNGEPAGSPHLQPYFRGATLDLYDGREWREPPGEDYTDWLRIREDAPLVFNYTPGPRDRVLEQRIHLLNPGDDIFAAYLPYKIASDGSTRIYIRPRDRTMRLDTQGRSGPLTYTVSSLLRITPELAGQLEFGKELKSWEQPLPWQRVRAGPRFDPRRVVSKAVRDYVDRLVADLPLPTDPDSIIAVANRIEEHLRSDRFTYTLERSDVDPNREAMEDFLLHRRRGHCQYFASALALMCQLQGINARVVNGYRGGEWNATGAYYMVREEHAHTWVEVHTGRDWVTYDPTPGSVNVEHNSYSLLSLLTGMTDQVDVWWAEHVVSYSASSRENLLAVFGLWLGELGKQGSLPAEIFYAARELLLGPEALRIGYRLLYLVVVALCIWTLVMLVRLSIRPARMWWRWLARTANSAARRPRKEAFYTHTLDLLGEMGHPKNDSDTALEFLSGLADRERRFSDLPEIARAFYHVHFGGRSLARDQRRRVASIISRLGNASQSR
jgi:hypothetical protein